MNTIHTPNAPAAVGPYSQAAVVGSLVFTSGQIPIDPRTGALIDGPIEEQARQVFENLGAILGEAGSDLAHAVKTTCYLRRMSDFAAFNRIYEEYFPSKPARSCVEVSALPKGAGVEVEVIAERVR